MKLLHDVKIIPKLSKFRLRQIGAGIENGYQIRLKQRKDGGWQLQWFDSWARGRWWTYVPFLAFENTERLERYERTGRRTLETESIEIIFYGG